MIGLVNATGSIAARTSAVRERVAAAAGRAGRDPAGVTIVAVAKTHPPEAVRAVVAEGIGDIGENTVQEWRAKHALLAQENVRWHFVGSLQRNKVGAVAGEVALVHGVDSVRLAEAIGARAARAGLIQPVLLQVNVTAEASKHGVELAAAAAAADEIGRIDGLALRGLMTIPPAGDLVAARRAFRTLRELQDDVVARHPAATELSMGMSADFEAAIEEGATLVRIGTAIFGPREA